jgi:hypothetical protein
MATTPLPFDLSVAPFPEGFQGDMDETFQQFCQLATGTIQGNFLTGLILPPGSTLPTTDQGPIAMGGTWYFWDPTTSQYLPQSVTVKPTKNFCRNPIYQVAQQGTSFTLGAGVTQTYDLALARSTLANVLAIAVDVGPPASVDNDQVISAMRYTVGPTLVPTLAAADLYSHEHLIEGADIGMLQGQITTLSFFAWVNQAGTYSAYITNTGRDHSYVFQFSISSTQASTWVRVNIPAIPAFPTAGTWSYAEGATGLYVGVPLGVGSQWQTANLSSWQPAFYAGSAQNSNLLTVLNNQMKVTGFKFEEASVPSYLQVSPFSQDFEEMQRYYYTGFSYQSTTVGIPVQASAQTTNAVLWSFAFPRRMCKAPTVVPYGFNSHASGNVTDLTSGVDIATATLAATQKGVVQNTTPTVAKTDELATIIRADARLT